MVGGEGGLRWMMKRKTALVRKPGRRPCLECFYAGFCLVSFRIRDRIIEKRWRTLLRRTKCTSLLFPADPLPISLVSFSPTLRAAFLATLFPVSSLNGFVEPSHEIYSFYNSKRGEYR